MARRALRFFVVPQNESVADEKTRTKTPRPPLVRDRDAFDQLIFNLEVEVERLVQPFRAHPFPGLLDRAAERELWFPPNVTLQAIDAEKHVSVPAVDVGRTALNDFLELKELRHSIVPAECAGRVGRVHLRHERLSSE